MHATSDDYLHRHHLRVNMQVGWAPDGGESTGHESGRIIVDLLQKDEDDYDDNDLKHMRKVISYVHRHSAQGPSKDVEHSRWRYSLMNWWACQPQSPITNHMCLYTCVAD